MTTNREKYVKLKKAIKTADQLERNLVKQLVLVVRIKESLQREHDQLKQVNHFFF